MSDFKFLSEEETSRILYLNEHAGFLYIPNNVLTIENEFCFQFDDDEPVRFANGEYRCTITLDPSPDGNVTFQDGHGRTFKLFARSTQQNEQL